MADSLFELITVKEYAAIRGVSDRTVREWIRKGWVTAERTTGLEHGHWRVKVPRAKAS